jgi:hypothetical protein
LDGRLAILADLLWFPSDSSGKWWDRTLKQAATASFHILPNSSSTVILLFDFIQPMQMKAELKI